MQLKECLQTQSLRHLEAIHRCRGFSFDTHLPKSLVVDELAIRLQDPEPAWHTLSAEARAALIALWEAAGHLREEEFVHRFGEIRAYKPWQPGAPRAPWRDPRTPAEEVVFGGLAFQVNQGARDRPLYSVVLPDEFHEPLRRLAALPTPSAGVRAPPPLPLSPPLLGDMFAFVSFLHRREIRPIWGRWLPPTALRALNRHLSRPGEAEGVRSERQVPYVAFLHYLAEGAGLVGVVADRLKPTLLAHQWLEESLPGRLQRLWDAWRSEADQVDAAGEDRASLWATYRLPGWKVGRIHYRFRRLLAHLSRRSPGQAQPAADFLDALVAADPPLFRIASYAQWAALSPGTQAHFQARVWEALVALLDGPLAWFGVLDGDPPALTSTAAALLGREDGAWPADPPPAPLVISPRLHETGDGQAAALLTAPPGLPLPQRLALEALVPPDPHRPGVYLLSRQRLLRALQGGHAGGVDGVLNDLEGAAQEPLPPAVVGAIYRWAEEHERLAIRQVLLLEARDPGLLRELTGARRIRETLGETFSARAIRVRADRLPALLRRLAARGHYPRLDLGASPSSTDREKGSQDEEAIVAVALLVYAALARELNLPLRSPYALAHACTEGLSLAQRDAVERAVAETLARLRRAAIPEGDYRLPTAAGPLLRQLERAIAGQATVEIRYYTAGRDHESTRRVDPLRIEWRGPVAYLVAHCHLRGEQRVFRVDRIAALRLL